MSTPLDSGGAEQGLAPPVVASPIPSTTRLVMFAGFAGLLAGLMAWLMAELILPIYLPTTTQVDTGSVIPHLSLYDHAEADYKNAIIAYTLLGVSLGLQLGLAAGLARQRTASAIRAGGIGAILGGILAAVVAAVVLPVYFREDELNPEQLTHDLMLPLLVHAGSWAAAGLGGGLAWGLGLGVGTRADRVRVYRAGLGGLLGAIVGAILYELVGGLGFPGDNSGHPISLTRATRLIARVAVAVCAALTAAAMAESRSRRVAPPTPTAPASGAGSDGESRLA